MVTVTDLRKIRDVPFPFPYSQFLSLMPPGWQEVEGKGLHNS